MSHGDRVAKLPTGFPYNILFILVLRNVFSNVPRFSSFKNVENQCSSGLSFKSSFQSPNTIKLEYE